MNKELKKEYLDTRHDMINHQYDLGFIERWATEAGQDSKELIKKVKEYKYRVGTVNELVDELDGYFHVTEVYKPFVAGYNRQGKEVIKLKLIKIL